MPGKFVARVAPPTNVEKYASRDLHYSQWHRQFPGLGFVDIDHVEMCKKCQRPLALIETAMDIGQDLRGKKAFVTAKLAKLAGIPAYRLLYKIEDDKVVKITWQQITFQEQDFAGAVFTGTPQEWAEELYDIHRAHEAIFSCRVVTANCNDEEEDDDYGLALQ